MDHDIITRSHNKKEIPGTPRRGDNPRNEENLCTEESAEDKESQEVTKYRYTQMANMSMGVQEIGKLQMKT